jgi:hypothetical protein
MDIRNPKDNTPAIGNRPQKLHIQDICVGLGVLILIQWAIIGLFLYGCMVYCGMGLRVQLISMRETSMLQEWISFVCCIFVYVS